MGTPTDKIIILYRLSIAPKCFLKLYWTFSVFEKLKHSNRAVTILALSSNSHSILISTGKPDNLMGCG